MRNLLSLIIYIGILIFLAFTFAPLIIVVLIAGFIYTVYSRYKLKQVIKEEQDRQEEFMRYEEPKENLAVIEAEYEEKTK